MISFLEKLAGDTTSLNAYTEAIFSNIRMAILDRNCRIIWVNEQFCDLAKRCQEELLGHSIRALNIICYQPGLLTDIHDTISRGNYWSGEIKSRDKSGSHFWVKTNILPIRNSQEEIETYLLFVSNITATKEALEEKNALVEKLVQSQARYRALVENQSDLVSLCTATGTFIFANSSFCQFVGKTIDEVVGAQVTQLRPSGLPFQYTQHILSLTQQHPEASGIFELENAQGKRFWISLNAKGIFDAHDNLFEILIIGRNVTELKNADLQKSNYISDLERIAFMTSHNVRGPIATMLGLIELLRLNAIHTDQWNQVLESFKKCIADLDFYTRELGAYIYQRQSVK